MKYVGRYITCMSIITLFLLVYVHQQLSIIQHSYVINKKEKSLMQLAEVNKNLKFQLASLKSPTLLEQKLAEAQINLVLPHEVNIVTIPIVRMEPFQIAQANVEKPENPLLAMFGFEKEAQAEFSD